jgi:riboflavin-specific deaminase-like protein
MGENTSQSMMQHNEKRSNPQSSSNSDLEDWLDRLPYLADAFRRRHHRPLVTVSYAQSVDGSIATRNREQLQLSSSQSMILTHRIRSSCDAIAIGINTLLTDNPQLTVRLVEGNNPQPIILDSNLRIPSKARILERHDHRCLLACTENNKADRISEVQGLGAEVIRCQPDHKNRVDLPHLLNQLGKRGITSIMVEGGSQVITSFLESRLVDQMIITIAPRLVGGMPILAQPPMINGARLSLNPLSFRSCGPDIILWAQPQWHES